MVRGRQELRIQGPRLNHTKEDKMMVRRGLDQRLNPIITPPMPLMEVRLICADFGKLNLSFRPVRVEARGLPSLYSYPICLETNPRCID